MEEFNKKVFYDMCVDLTGKNVFGCLFDGCIIELQNCENVITNIQYNHFINCKYIGDGWPEVIFEISI